MRLLEPVTLGSVPVRNAVVFGPLVTNLGRGRDFSERHVAFYERRALGGAGVVVLETASVDATDWPYERAPLAGANNGWAEVAAAVQARGARCVASLGHCGAQGSSAYHQRALLAPSRVPVVANNEVPEQMELAQCEALVAAFAEAAGWAMAAGCDGVEVNCGQHSLLRQFLSPLTNQRQDHYGQDRGLLLHQVLGQVRAVLGTAILGLRFSADELAPWAGITPEQAGGVLEGLLAGVDYVTVVRGSIYSEARTSPDAHEPQNFNRPTTEAVGAVIRAAGAKVVGQGSITAVTDAEAWLADGVADLVEMTRAQIADPDLVAKVAGELDAAVRPCTRCNQRCQVRDLRNPIVSCAVNPTAGHERSDLGLDDRDLKASTPGDLVVVGAGVAGLEAARVLASRGHRVTVLERRSAAGGALALAARAPGRAAWQEFLDWLLAECDRLGVRIELGVEADLHALGPARTLLATGGVDRQPHLRDGDDGSVPWTSASRFLDGEPVVGPVVIDDPIGGPIAISVAEALAPEVAVHLVSPDVVPGSQLSMVGDLVAASARLAHAGVMVHLHHQVVGIHNGEVLLEDRFTGRGQALEAAMILDGGHRIPGVLPDEARGIVVGDAVAPRSCAEAVLEARRGAAALSDFVVGVRR